MGKYKCFPVLFLLSLSGFMDIRKRREQQTHHFTLSVILPTYNRVDILARTLTALEKQTLPKNEFEVIVVNDGSDDGTDSFLERYKNSGKLNFSYLTKENEGQGIARNAGLKLADGYIVVFTQDDHIPDPTFLAEHKRVHEVYATHNFMCLGYTTWHPELDINPYMRYLEHSGMQFNYPALEKRKLIDPMLGVRLADFHFFYGGNVSVKRLLLDEQHFDPRFKKYGWEDIELGYRLEKEEHAILLYHRGAKAFHYHEQTESELPKRMKQVGRSARLAQKIAPKMRITPPWWKHVIFFLLANRFSKLLVDKVTLALEKKWPPSKPLPLSRRLRYYVHMKHYFLAGLSS